MPNSQAAPESSARSHGLDVPWLLRMRAEMRARHPFLIWAPFDAPARRWSYGEFHERVGALAAGLAKRGVKPGEYVLIHLDNCIEAMLAWFACVELGAIAVTTNTRSAPAEMEYFADHCGAVAAITQPAYAEIVAAALPQPALDGGDLARCGRSACASGRRAATVSKRCSPTAPTGRGARPIRSRHAACNTPPARHRGRRRCCGPTPTRCGAPRSTPRIEDLHAGDVHQTYLPLFHTNALAYSMLATLWVGATCVIQPRFSASRFWSVAREHGCDLDLDDSVLHEGAARAGDPDAITNSGCGAPRSTSRRPFAAFGIKIIGWWGMTETITHGIVGEVDQPNIADVDRPRRAGISDPHHRR